MRRVITSLMRSLCVMAHYEPKKYSLIMECSGTKIHKETLEGIRPQDTAPLAPYGYASLYYRNLVPT